MTPKLYLCGLGHFPPQTTSLNVLHCLARCDVVISPRGDAGARDVIEDFSLGRRRIFCGAKADAPVFKELQKGQTVGFVTRGHPLLFDATAARLVRRCAQTGIACETFGAVSPVGMMMARLNKTLGVDMHGIQTYGCEVFEGGKVVNTLQPLVVYFKNKQLGKKALERLGRAMRRSYPAEHYCWMFGTDYEASYEAFRLEDLGRRFPAINPGRILYVPSL